MRSVRRSVPDGCGETASPLRCVVRRRRKGKITNEEAMIWNF